MSRARALRAVARLLGGAALACAALACLAPPGAAPSASGLRAGPAPTATSGPPAAAARTPAGPSFGPSSGPRTEPPGAPLVLPATVRVRLEALERRAVVEVLAGGGGPVTLRRAGGDVVASTGARGASVTLPAPAGGWLRVADREYPGALVVSAHPVSGLRVHNEAPLEDYVAGVVASELSIWSAPPAELEAQAVAARTYALGQLRHRARDAEAVELLDSVQDQAYRGRYQAAAPAARAVAERLAAAIGATRGLVLLRGERLEEARFCASCGGHTASFADVFTDPRFDPGPAGVPCPPCQERARREAAADAPDGTRPLGWRASVPHEALGRAGAALRLGGPIEALGPKRLDASGRWIDAQVRGPRGVVVVPYDDLRRALGYGLVKSARLVRAAPAFGQPLRAGVLLEGLGRGHGVGLCQEGARDLARQGWTAAAILAHYYPGTRLERLPAAGAVEAGYGR